VAPLFGQGDTSQQSSFVEIDGGNEKTIGWGPGPPA
jgi:hypothetical protein